MYFNPRAPCGARLVKIPLYSKYIKISIHAPRVGRDASFDLKITTMFGFQSTRPVWGATNAALAAKFVYFHFNPRAPCGARQPRP